MRCLLELACVGLTLAACGGESAKTPSAEAPPASPITPMPPVVAPKPAAVAAVAVPGADNPCAHPTVQTVELELGVPRKTPFNLELTYANDEDRKLGPGFMFFLQYGDRRWETRRDLHNWTKPLLWRGFCWRGVDRPTIRAKQLRVELAPLCKDGVLAESGGKCSSVFTQ